MKGEIISNVVGGMIGGFYATKFRKTTNAETGVYAIASGIAATSLYCAFKHGITFRK